MAVSHHQTVASTSSADPWSLTLDSVKSSVVALKVTFLRAFSGDSPQTSRATGFVVSEDLILTNRHVVGAGPITATALFDQSEEIPVYAVYRDPVHDFGFLKFDKSQLRFTTVTPIPLSPEALAPGIEIRVIGNDSGEKMQILSGIIGRIDRNPPLYSGTITQDENTFYVGSASNTSGGSSGSPVINVCGHAVALNAGGATMTASAFYLPLDRVKRCLEWMLGGFDRLRSTPSPNDEGISTKIGGCFSVEVPRGTIEAAFKFQYFDAVARLGVPECVEKEVVEHQTLRVEKSVRRGLRAKPKPDVRPGFFQPLKTKVKKSQIKTGMLTVESVIPNGVAFKAGLLSGDVLYKINNTIIAEFVSLEEVLDDYVGEELDSIEVFRGKKLVKLGGADLSSGAKIMVQDLNAYLPDEFVEFGGGVFHKIPYSYAKVMNVAADTGVWTASRGFIFGNKIQSFSILYSVNDEEIRAGGGLNDNCSNSSTRSSSVSVVQDFVNKLQRVGHRDRFSVTWHKQIAGESRTQKSGGILMERQLVAKPVVWLRGKKTHPKEGDVWFKKEEADADEKENKENAASGTTQPPPTGLANLKNFWTAPAQVPDWAKEVLKSLVLVEYRSPSGAEILDHNSRSVSLGTGVVVAMDEDYVLVVTGRETVPQQFGVITVEFAKILKVFARVKFIHPFHNVCLLAIQRKELGDYPLCEPLRWISKGRAKFAPGDETNFVGLTDKGEPVIQETNLLTQFCPDYKLTMAIYSTPLDTWCTGNETSRGGTGTGTYPLKSSEQQNEWEYGLLGVWDYVAPLFGEGLDQRLEKGDRSCSVGGAEVEALAENNCAEEQTSGPPASKKRRKTEESVSEDSCVEDEQGPHAAEVQDLPPSPFRVSAVVSSIASLGCEFRPISLSEAAHHGIEQVWVNKLLCKAQESNTATQAMLIDRITAESCAEKHGFRVGDVLAAVNGRVCVVPLQVEIELMLAAEKRISVTLLRGKTEIVEHNVAIDSAFSDTSDKLLVWLGLVIIPTPKAVFERGSKKNGGKNLPKIYVPRLLGGGPAVAEEMQSGFFLEQIDDHSLEGKGFDDLVELLRSEKYSSSAGVKEPESGAQKVEKASFNSTFTRIMIRDLEGREFAKSLRRDDLFFPAACVTRKGDDWEQEYHREKL
eukprot:g17190.t1